MAQVVKVEYGCEDALSLPLNGHETVGDIYDEVVRLDHWDVPSEPRFVLNGSDAGRTTALNGGDTVEIVKAAGRKE